MYTACLSSQFTKWVGETEEGKEPEWCGAEKHAYLEYMRKALPTQYENVMRLEQNNF